MPNWIGYGVLAWAPSSNINSLLPAMFRAPTTTGDWRAGDVIMYPVDAVNGNPSLGLGNYLFTSNVSGRFNIVGSVWFPSTGFTDRPQDYELLLNGSVVASGMVNYLVTSGNPDRFSIPDVSFSPGTTVELAMYKDAASPTYGIFIDSTLTIESTPEPGTLALLLGGFAALGVVRWRNVQRNPA